MVKQRLSEMMPNIKVFLECAVGSQSLLASHDVVTHPSPTAADPEVPGSRPTVAVWTI